MARSSPLVLGTILVTPPGRGAGGLMEQEARTTGVPTYYQITVRGPLDARWSGWFDGLVISPGPDGNTILAGPVPDPATLYGYLSRARDLGLILLAVTACDPAA